MTTLNIRVDEKIKEAARKTFASMGLDMSSAVNLFLNQVIVEQAIPFTPSNKNAKAIRAKWDAEVSEALKGKGYKNAREMHKAIINRNTYARVSNKTI